MIVSIYTELIEYQLNINNKYTWIKGDSGTGKTTLVNLIARSLTDSFIVVKSPYKCVALYPNEDITKINNSIIFIDEEHPILNNNNASQLFKNTSSFIVIVSRELSKYLIPLSIDSFLEIKNDGKVNRTSPIYQKGLIKLNQQDIQNIVTEDEHSGSLFLKEIFKDKNNLDYITSNGIRNLCKTLHTQNLSPNYLVCYDTLASGWEQDIIDEYVEKYNLNELSWESFESYALQCLNKYPKTNLNLLSLNSKEQYLTKILRDYLYKNGYKYTKTTLPDILNPTNNKDMLQFGLEKLNNSSTSDLHKSDFNSITFGE